MLTIQGHNLYIRTVWFHICRSKIIFHPSGEMHNLRESCRLKKRECLLPTYNYHQPRVKVYRIDYALSSAQCPNRRHRRSYRHGNSCRTGCMKDRIYYSLKVFGCSSRWCNVTDQIFKRFASSVLQRHPDEDPYFEVLYVATQNGYCIMSTYARSRSLCRY